MKCKILVFIVLSFQIACSPTKQKNNIVSKSDYFKLVTVDTLLKEKINSRAILALRDKVYYAGDIGRVGFINYSDKKRTEFSIKNVEHPLEFRSIAQTSDAIFVLNVGSPAQLYRLSKDLSQNKLVYEEKHPKVFYDSMQFWNDTDGIAMGDPTADCLSIIRTHDGGSSWQKIPCGKLPKVDEGEAAFAASNSNIILKGKHLWIVSGGKKARVYHSSNHGKNWDVAETPIIQGSEMTGIFTADFYDIQNGFIAGGNYEKQNQNFSNKAISSDKGNHWSLVGEHQGFGYASCIQYVPESKASALVCIAGDGLYYSHDFGETWKMLLETKTLYTIRFVNKFTAVAAGRDGIYKIDFQY